MSVACLHVSPVRPQVWKTRAHKHLDTLVASIISTIFRPVADLGRK